MTRHGFWRLGVEGMSAISGIEIALWDILGKSLGVPVWRLLGGKVRNHLRTYTHLGLGDMKAVYESSSVEAIVERGRIVTQAGYDAVKVVCIPYTHYVAPAKAVDAVAEMVGALREAVGPEVDIMVDFHGRPASVDAAMDYIRAIEPARIMFAEEPLPPEDVAGLAHITASARRCRSRRASAWSAAASSRRRSRRAPSTSPSPTSATPAGCSRPRRSPRLAETAGIGLAPHNPLGPLAGVAALHFGISTPNVIIQEEMSGAVAWYDDVVTWPIKRRPGRWDAPELPGLGVTVNEEIIAAHPFKQEILHARNAVMPDGTVVDW